MQQPEITAVKGGMQYVMEPPRKSRIEDIRRRAEQSARNGYDITIVTVRRFRRSLVQVTIKGNWATPLSELISGAQSNGQLDPSVPIDNGLLRSLWETLPAHTRGRAWDELLMPITQRAEWVVGYWGDSPPVDTIGS